MDASPVVNICAVYIQYIHVFCAFFFLVLFFTTFVFILVLFLQFCRSFLSIILTFYKWISGFYKGCGGISRNPVGQVTATTRSQRKQIPKMKFGPKLSASFLVPCSCQFPAAISRYNSLVVCRCWIINWMASVPASVPDRISGTVTSFVSLRLG